MQAEVIETSTEPVVNTQKIKQSKTTHRVKWLIFAGFAAIILSVWSLQKSSPIKRDATVLILPVQSHIDHTGYQWLAEKGSKQLGEQLQSKLAGQHAQQTVEVTDSAQFSETLRAQRIESIHRQLSAQSSDWLVDIKLYGDVFDYKWIVHLHSSDSFLSSVVFSKTLDQGFEHVADSVNRLLSLARDNHELAQTQNRKQSMLAEAMHAYETDWQMALPIFISFIEQYPDSAIARYHLGLLYVWSDNLDAAFSITQQGLAPAETAPLNKAQLCYVQGLMYQRQGLMTKAMAVLKQAAELIEPSQHWLMKAKIEELMGDISYQQDQPVQALRAYQRAFALNEKIHSSVNMAAIQIKLATLHLGNGHIQLARKDFAHAKAAIQQGQMSFLYAALTEFERKYPYLLVE